jgi:hypothetical protein
MVRSQEDGETSFPTLPEKMSRREQRTFSQDAARRGSSKFHQPARTSARANGHILLPPPRIDHLDRSRQGGVSTLPYTQLRSAIGRRRLGVGAERHSGALYSVVDGTIGGR